MKIKLLLIFSLFYLQLSAQNFPTDNRIALTVESLDMVQTATMPDMDNQALLDAELARRGPGIAPKYAENIEVDITPFTHGNWEDLSDGNSVWRMKIESAGAKSLNLGFTKYFMPENGTLVMYSPNYERVIGPFTPSDNEEHEQLWTPILDGDELVIEVQVPTVEKQNLQLELSYVNHDYIGFSSMASGSCNLDVICDATDGWGIVDGYRDIIQSVAVIGTGGGTFCTGFLVNTANNDCAPMFMTAFHCGINSGNAASLVTYWNFFNSTCREPGSGASGGNGDGSLADFNTGSTFRAGWAPSDFVIVELDDPVSPTADAFFAGWDATETMTWDTVIGVHHPSTDEKRISFEFDPTFTGSYLAGTPEPNGDHITVEDWDIGTTEGGSSGSPLFNAEKRVVGQLHGGFASCSSQTLDSYGWMFSSWEGGGTPSTRLRDWLDPNNTGTLVIDGRSQQQCSFFVEAMPAVVDVCAPDDAVFTISATESFAGDVTLSITNVPAGATATFAENPIAAGATTTLTISNTNAVAAGSYTINLAGTDGTNANDNNLTLNVFDGAPAPTVLVTPAVGGSDISTSPTFTWDAAAGITYEIEIATDNAFTDVVATATGIMGGTYTATALTPQTMYFWRVRGTNFCGEGNFPAAYFFTTATINCVPNAAADVPVLISSAIPNTVTSTFEIGQNGTIENLDVTNLVIEHTYIGDLVISLTSPAGTTVLLVDLDSGGCDNADLSLNFDDDAISTNAELVGMCEANSPAASGTYQSAEALSAFDGQVAAGTWILTVEDMAGYDGGQLVSWSLDICTIVSDDFSFIASPSTLMGCIEETVSFDITIGGAFDDANGGVNLSGNNLPAGTVASFSQNPAMPGSMVTVTLENPAESGGFSIEINGDDGTNPAVSAGLIWNVNPAPAATSAINPADNAMDQPISMTMEWGAIPLANSYNYILATDPDFTNIVTTFPAINPAFLQTGLEYNTTYYWMVTAVGDCGLTDSEVFQFTTFPDLAVGLSPENEIVCLADDAIFTLNIGEGFGTATITANNLPGSATVDFDMNPAMGGSTVTATVSNLVTAPAGTYTIDFTVEDDNGVTNVSAELTVEAPPAISSLQLPENGDDFIPLDDQTFSWEAVSDVDGYLFEISLTEDFTQIVESTTTTNTSYTLLNELEEETLYFWRVTSTNNCGSSVSLFFNFTSDESNSTHEVLGVQVRLQPNPTRDFVNITLSAPLNETLSVDVYAINGQLLQTATFSGQTTQHQLVLTAYSAGIYLVKIVTGDTAVVERIVLEK